METQKVVVAGEASESDDDDFTDTQNTQSGEGGSQTEERSRLNQESSVIITGEASESEEEYEMVNKDNIPTGITPLTVETSQKSVDVESGGPQSPDVKIPQKPKYNSLLCRKLRERNTSLRRHIVDSIHGSYTMAAKDIHNLAVQLQKSHLAIQDVSYLMRETTNGLFKLEDKVDIVGSCCLLPDIHLPNPTAAAATGTNQPIQTPPSSVS